MADSTDKPAPSPNFAFLAKHDPLLVHYSALAERYVFDDSNTALIKLGQLAKLLAKKAAAEQIEEVVQHAYAVGDELDLDEADKHAKSRKARMRHLRTAIRRQAVVRDGDMLTCPTSIFCNYENDFLLDRFRSIMRPGREYERTEVALNLAHYFGYRSVSKGMQKQLKSIFNSAIRRDVIQSQGKHIWRES